MVWMALTACSGSEDSPVDEEGFLSCGRYTSPEPDPSQCGTLEWQGTFPIDPTSGARDMYPEATAVDPTKGTLVFASGTIASCGVRPTALITVDASGNRISSEPLNVGGCISRLVHDGTRVLGLTHGEAAGSELELLDLRAPEEAVLRVGERSPGSSPEIALDGGRLFVRDGEIYSVPFPGGGERTAVPAPSLRVGPKDSGPDVGFAWNDFGRWSGRLAFENCMTNVLFVTPRAAPELECAFSVERFRGLTGAVISTMAASGDRVFVVTGASMAVFRHVPPGP